MTIEGVFHRLERRALNRAVEHLFIISFGAAYNTFK
jgi:hypothetical protein